MPEALEPFDAVGLDGFRDVVCFFGEVLVVEGVLILLVDVVVVLVVEDAVFVGDVPPLVDGWVCVPEVFEVFVEEDALNPVQYVYVFLTVVGFPEIGA